jgi:SseB protein N-terminal domain/SseB protein C-terminal domain
MPRIAPLMFEPENELERVLVAVATGRSRRADFLRELIDANVFVGMSIDRELEVDANGKATVPAGAILQERVVTRDGTTFMAFFTAPARAKAIFKETHLIAPDTTRAVFERHPGASFALNPGSEYSHEFLPAEVDRMLAGDFALAAGPATVTKAFSVVLSQPLPYPAELTEALKLVFATCPTIELAYLAQVDHPQRGRYPVIAIEITNRDWRDVMEDLEMDLQRAAPGRMDFVPCPGGPYDDYFSGIEPFYRRPEPEKGWRRWFSRGG